MEKESLLSMMKPIFSMIYNHFVMNNKILLLFVLLALCLPQCAQADNSISEDGEILRYGDAGTPVKSLGMAGTAATGWYPPKVFDAGSVIWLGAEERAQYAGTSVKTLKFYHGIIRDMDAKTIHVFVRNGLNGEDVFTDEVSVARHNEAALVSYDFKDPIEINPGDEPLVFGWYIHIDDNANGGYSTIWAVDMVRDLPAYSNDAISRQDDGDWKLENDHGYYGNLCVWLELQSNDFPKNNVSLHSLVIPRTILSGGTFDYKFKITNRGSNAVSDVSVRTAVGNETPVVQNVKIAPPLAYGATAECTLEANCVRSGVVPVTVTACEVNGEDDSSPFDNSQKEYMLSLTNETDGFDRNVLIEEDGSTRCTWCPRGIVGMKRMKEKYKDNPRLVQISVHEDDPMEISTYKQFSVAFVPSQPFAVLDRKVGIDPAFENLDAAFRSCLDIPAYSRLDLEVTVDEENRRADMVSEAEFFFDDFGERYKIAYVIVEDNVGPYSQLNSYAGSGTPMGGFEDLGNPCSITYDDVAVSSTEAMGIADVYPENLKPGEKYVHSVTLDFPEKSKNKDCRFIAYLINVRTNAIENVVQTSLSKDDTGISGVETDSRSDAPVVYYNLQGIRVNPDNITPGIYIRCCNNERTKVLLR